MSFTRHGSDEEGNLEPVIFKCPKCGKNAVTLVNGICEMCGLQKDADALKKLSKRSAKHKKNKN